MNPPPHVEACVGWSDGSPCPMYGDDLHGCRHPDGHLGDHTCLCGAKARAGR